MYLIYQPGTRGRNIVVGSETRLLIYLPDLTHALPQASIGGTNLIENALSHTVSTHREF